jgi:hypothetical protein
MTIKARRVRGGVSPSGPGPQAPTPAAPAHSDFKYNNGAVIRSPQVHTSFWGPHWSDATHSTRATRLNQFVRDLLASNYMNVLSQYGVGAGAGSAGTLVGTTFVSSLTSQLDEAGIASVIQGQIDGGAIPEPPATNNNVVLIIFLDESIAVSQPGLRMCEATSDDAFGFHFDFVTTAGHEFYYAVIPSLDNTCITNTCPGGDSTCSLKTTQTQEQRLTQVTSHEFAEMVTDPKFRSGWFGPTSDENGDICNGQSGTITVGANTWTVQRQYSKTDDENSNGATFCVIGATTPMPKRADGPPDPKTVIKDIKDAGDTKLPRDTKNQKDTKDAKEHKDTKDRKDVKDRKDKEKEKELLKDHKDQKDLKDRKEKEIIKDAKDIRDGRAQPFGGSGAPGASSIEQRLSAVEDAVAQLTHFIQSGQRPDLSMSPLANEADLQSADLDALSAQLQLQADEAKRIKDDKDLEKLRDA